MWWCEPAAPDLERERQGHSWGSLAAGLLGEFQTNESLSQKRRLIASKEQERAFFPYTHSCTHTYTLNKMSVTEEPGSTYAGPVQIREWIPPSGAEAVASVTQTTQSR